MLIVAEISFESCFAVTSRDYGQCFKIYKMWLLRKLADKMRARNNIMLSASAHYEGFVDVHARVHSSPIKGFDF